MFFALAVTLVVGFGVFKIGQFYGEKQESTRVRMALAAAEDSVASQKALTEAAEEEAKATTDQLTMDLLESQAKTIENLQIQLRAAYGRQQAPSAEQDRVQNTSLL